MTEKQALKEGRELAMLYGGFLKKVKIVNGEWVAYIWEHGCNYYSVLGKAGKQPKTVKSDTINSLEQAKLSELQEFVSNCLRRKSPKTGKSIKINTFKWKKSDVIALIKKADCEDNAIAWLNK